MKSGILRKRNLLQYMFPNDEIHCWIITNFSGKLRASNSKNIEVFKTPKYELNPDILRTRDKSSKPLPLNKSKYKSLYELQYQVFDYFRILKEIHKQVRIEEPEKIKETLKVLVKPYVGLIERFFVGKMSGKEFVDYIKDRGYKSPIDMRISYVYFALRMEEDLSIEQRLYLRTRNNKAYEITDLKNMEIKRVHGKKRTTRDINYLDNMLKPLSTDDWIKIRSQI